MHNELISVIVPIYNVEKYLIKCLDSIINQTYENLEIILVDDGSFDSSRNICEKYKENDSRVKVIHKKNQGLGYARNSGIKIAKGKYILFVDSDDFIEKTMIEKLYNSIIKYDSDAAYCNYYEFYDDNHKIFRQCCPDVDFFIGKEIIDKYLIGMIGCEPKAKVDFIYSMSVWHSLFRLELIKKYNIEFPSEREYISEDIIFDIHYLKKSKKISFVNLPLYYYRCNNESSLTKIIAKNEFQKNIKLMNKISETLENGDIYRVYIDRYFLSRLRTYLRKIEASDINYKIKKAMVKNAINDKYTKDVLKRYPVNQNPAKLKIFNYMLKYRCCYLIRMILKLKKNKKYSE